MIRSALTLLTAFTAFSALCAAPVLGQDFAITNATVATGDGGAPIDDGTVVVRGGKIVAAGRGVAVPADIARIDGSGKWVTPGIFAATSDLGLFDVSGVASSNDLRARGSPFNAAIDVSRAINPSSQHILVSRAGGVTRASVAPAPGKSIFAGQGAVIDLGDDAYAVQRPRAFQLVVLGEAGARLAGGSRSASHLALRSALQEARDFASGRWNADSAQLTREDASALGAVINGRQKLYIHAERASDIRGIIALKREYGALDLVLLGAGEGWMVAREIAAAGIPVIADPLDDLPDRFEQLAATQSNVGRMHAAGVEVAIGGIGAFDQTRNLPQFAGNLVALQDVPGASGLSWGQALAAITSIPAKISGLGGKAGVLRAGAVGDVVLWDGDPLELSSAPVKVFIDGVEQPLDNHQTRLRERYRDLDESQRPKAYDW